MFLESSEMVDEEVAYSYQGHQEDAVHCMGQTR
jgi:hypothetical protein